MSDILNRNSKGGPDAGNPTCTCDQWSSPCPQGESSMCNLLGLFLVVFQMSRANHRAACVQYAWVFIVPTIRAGVIAGRRCSGSAWICTYLLH